MNELQIWKWAITDDEGNIVVPTGPRQFAMQNSDGTGEPLLKNGAFGADIIRFGPHEGVGEHTHPGSHMLFVIKGSGFVDFCGAPHDLEPGLCYLIPPNTAHAIRATTELVMIAVADDHRDLSSIERMIPVP